MCIVVIFALLALGCFWIGALGFTSRGLPLSKNKTLTGTSAKVVGMLCFVLGALLLVATAILLGLVLVGTSMRTQPRTASEATVQSGVQQRSANVGANRRPAALARALPSHSPEPTCVDAVRLASGSRVPA